MYRVFYETFYRVFQMLFFKACRGYIGEEQSVDRVSIGYSKRYSIQGIL